MSILMVVDDNQLVLNSLLAWLQKSFVDCDLIGFDSGEKAISFCQSHRIDVALIDVHLSGTNGIELTKEILKSDPSAQIIVTSVENAARYHEEAVAAGAKLFVPKQDLYRNLNAHIESLEISNCESEK